MLFFSVNDNHAVINTRSNFQGLSGVGLTSGDRYHLGGAGHSTISVQLDGFTETNTFVDTFTLVGQGRAPNLRLRSLQHYTINNNGEPTFEHVSFTVECQ